MPVYEALPPWNKPFAEQLAFFKRKLNLPSEAWDDIMRQAHDKAFMVAGAQSADLLVDLRGAITKAIESGTGIEAFRKDFKQIVAKHGWTGWTGEESAARTAWRTKVIYQTNMSTSYAAGRWQQLNDPELLKAMPYWQYKHSDSVVYPRPLHQSWDGLTLPPDHSFWKQHYPPNGWGCQCRVIPVTKAAFMRAVANGRGPANAPPAGDTEGIDVGFEYAPGANVTRPLQDFIDQKLIKLDAPIGAQMWQHLKPALAVERQLAWNETLDNWQKQRSGRGEKFIIGAVHADTLAWLEVRALPQPVTAEIGIEDRLVIGKKQTRHVQAQNGLTLDEWRELPALVDEPGAIYFDTHSGNLIYVNDGIGATKIAVQFDPKKTSKTQGINTVRTTFRISAEDIAADVKGGIWKVIKVSGG